MNPSPTPRDLYDYHQTPASEICAWFVLFPFFFSLDYREVEAIAARRTPAGCMYISLRGGGQRKRAKTWKRVWIS